MINFLELQLTRHELKIHDDIYNDAVVFKNEEFDFTIEFIEGVCIRIFFQDIFIVGCDTKNNFTFSLKDEDYQNLIYENIDDLFRKLNMYHTHFTLKNSIIKALNFEKYQILL